MALSEKSCVPCRGGVPPLGPEEIAPLAREVERWAVVDNHHIERGFDFPDFKSALNFVNRVGTLAEDEGHHPDLHLSWGRVGVSIWTHKIDGLSESDFILAAKIDLLASHGD
jgi:4a-hydroxytetrahydrobiopterin dehydratase